MESLFVALTHAVTGSPLVALGAALAWGVLSVLLSPCHLASIPLIVGFINGQGQMPVRRAFLISSLFAIGILLTIAGIGFATAAAGRMLGDVGTSGNYLVAAVFFLVGLHLLDLLPMPWTTPGRARGRGEGILAAFLLGLVFGIALGPCSFAYMAPLLAILLSHASDHPGFGLVLLLAYGLGHCTVIVLAGTFTEVVQRYLDWNQRSRGAVIVKRVCGLLVIAGGVWLVYTTHP